MFEYIMYCNIMKEYFRQQMNDYTSTGHNSGVNYHMLMNDNVMLIAASY